MDLAFAAAVTQRIQYKHGNVDFKFFAVHRHAKEAAVHGACRCAQTRAAGVFKAFTGLQQRLMANHTQTFDFLVQAFGIIDVPGAGNQLSRRIAAIVDKHRVREGEQAVLRAGLFRQVIRRDFHAEFISWHGQQIRSKSSGT